MTQLTFRNGTEQDTKLILRFITELATHEGIEKDVVATESGLHKALFQEKSAEVIIAEYENAPVGFALFFHNFSTLLGKKGLYLETCTSFQKCEVKALEHSFSVIYPNLP